MTFYIQYRQDVAKVVQAVMIDARYSIGLGGQNGNVIQPAVDAEVIRIGANPYFYCIESEKGSLAAYFYLNDDGTLGGKLVRPNYIENSATFDNMISDFILSSAWQFDTLK